MIKKVKLGKKEIIGLSIAAVLLFGGGTAYAAHNKQVQARKIEEQKLQEKEDYKNLTVDVNESIQKAYDTRDVKDIKLAEEVIKKLKESDQTKPREKLVKLQTYLDLIKKTDQLIAIAEKTKKDSDIQAAQNSINEEKDEYLKKDKEAHQKRLDKLKHAIKEQKDKESKEKAEKEKKAEESKNKEESKTTQEEKKDTTDTVIREANESNDQSPSTPQETPVDQPVEQPNTPTDNGGNVYTPAPPTDNGGGSVAVTPEQPTPTPPPVDNGGGNSSGGNTGGGNVTPPPSNEYDPMTPVGSGGLFGSDGEATAAGLAKARELEISTGQAYRVQTWEVKYVDGRSAGWTYELVI
ncbi:hypothetical protein [Enterococcus faecalis]|uniref:hypothetical protein n=1 Tax=Enterococcus faecalis TaxID=1351 RepID=UPI002DBF4575|nr:hypothetical protein [Enterococcus faecalis]MEB8146448.1 hypothetical protein [Enterococcus faecalis]